MSLPKFKQKLPEPLTVHSMGCLLDATMGTKFHQIRNKAMLELMYATGMRVSELLGLSLPMIDLTECQVRICGKGGKERIIPFGLKARDAIAVYLEARGGRFSKGEIPLFLTSKGHAINRGTFWLELKHIALRAGLRGRVTPHQIRHSAATHMLEGGADIRVLQEFMGHSQITTTQRYAHVSAKLLKNTCNKSHPRF
jgi:site-specific recombinase XerD